MRLERDTRSRVPIEPSLLEDRDLVLEIHAMVILGDTLDLMDQDLEIVETIEIMIDHTLQQDYHKIRIS